MEQWFGCFSLGGDRNNGTMVWPTFGAGGTGTMEQWFDQLLGPGVLFTRGSEAPLSSFSRLREKLGLRLENFHPGIEDRHHQTLNPPQWKTSKPLFHCLQIRGTPAQKLIKPWFWSKSRQSPPRKVGQTIVPLFRSPQWKTPKPLNINQLGPEQCGTMWNNDCSGPNWLNINELTPPGTIGTII